MLKSPMIVSKTVNSKRQEVGSVDVYTPELTEVLKIIAEAKEVSKDEKDGLPVYDTQEANWVFGAIHNAVKMAARNKLENGTVKLKDGLTIATDLKALTEEGQRGGNGEGLAIVREAKAAFAEWAAKLGKSESTTTFITSLFNNRVALQTQPAHIKEKMAKYVEDFAVSLTDEQVERFERPLNAVVEACKVVADVEAATDF